MTKKGWFDTGAFYSAVDSQRLAKGKNWKEVAAASGVSASTLTRMSQGKRPDVDGLAALAAWSGIQTDEFVRTADEQERPTTAEPLAVISAQLHNDRNLTPEAATAIDELVKTTYERLKQPPGGLSAT